MDPFGTNLAPTEESTPSDADLWRDVPPSLRPGRRPARWPIAAAAVLLLLAVGVIVMWLVDVDYYALSPGPVSDVGDHVVVESGEADDQGELFFLTVSVKEVNALEALAAWLDAEVDLTPTESIRPADVTPEELRRINLDQMNLSKDTAIVVALERLGYEVTFQGNGALVSSVIAEGAAAGTLEPDDVIVAINREPVEFSSDAGTLLAAFRPGDTVTLTVDRPTDESATEFETFDADITLGVFRGVDEDGNEFVDENRGMVGVLLGNFNVEMVLPLEIEIDSQNIGGPSAGMMFTLEIYNQLSDQDLTAGRVVAGTGTIQRDGTIGSIGGVRQKVYAAIAAGADIILVPAGNYEEALTADSDEIEIVRVETIDQAIAFLESL